MYGVPETCRIHWKAPIRDPNGGFRHLKPLARSTVSGWFTGQTPPDDFDPFLALIEAADLSE
nr:hypothetical protein OG781_12515 [Streptomyces sp. NBC_00830]